LFSRKTICGLSKSTSSSIQIIFDINYFLG
jgi:hypothetical protein